MSVARGSVPRQATTIRGVALVALALSAVVPIGLLLLSSLSGRWFYPSLLPQSFSTAGWSALAQSGQRLGVALRGSVVLAVINGVVGCAVAFPLGRTIARLTRWARYVAAAAVFAPIAAPPIAFGIGVQYFFLSVGLGATALGVLLAHLVPTIGYLSLYFVGVFTVLETGAEDEARTLGATARQVLWLVTIPILRRQIVEAMAIGFLISWSQYALTLTVGAGAVHTLPLEVFAYMRDGQGSYAAAAALVMIVPPMLLLFAAQYASGAVDIGRAEARRTGIIPL
ncbi:MAG: ABC transporter permease [Gemmatimonadaceae bacterium]